MAASNTNGSGPWTWLGGSYPHPTMNDEQPGSFENFPDLHFSRVSGDRQRWAAWWYRNEQFTPLDLVPGYMTHQTPRNDAQGQCVRDRAFFTRDWDLLGWRYSVLSSIGTAPFNHVVDYLPARDEAEFSTFRRGRPALVRATGWTGRTSIANSCSGCGRSSGRRQLGRIDGTAAVEGDHGFVFLFNPNYRALDAVFPLDESIGLTSGERFVLRELYPRDGTTAGQAGGRRLARGDRCDPADQRSASHGAGNGACCEQLSLPALLNAEGTRPVAGQHADAHRGVTGRSR